MFFVRLSGHEKKEGNQMSTTGNKFFGFSAAIILLLTLGGCASTSNGTAKFEQMMIAGGFRMKPADTPEKLAHLQTLPQKRIVTRQKDGKVFYLFADPDQKALYVGDARAYRQFQDIRLQQQDAEQNAMAAEADRQAAEMRYESDVMWGAWDPWW